VRLKIKLDENEKIRRIPALDMIKPERIMKDF
jgi:hypothetical protein